MLKNKQSSRSLVAFLVTWSFLVLTVTGIVLYVVPQGRVAYWVHWSLGGLGKDDWAHVHMMFGGLFILTGVWHLYFNWGPFKKYLADKVQGHFQVKREVLISLLLSALIVVLSVMDLPPASWVFDLNDRVKAAWVTQPQLEPPFGHAEEVSLSGISRRMGLDLGAALEALRQKGIRFEGPRDSLETIARANGITPMDVYAVISPHVLAAEKSPGEVLTEADVEARFSGTGLGRRNLAEVCEQIGVTPATARQRLAARGISLADEETLRDAANRYALSPIDLVKAMLIPAGGDGPP